MGNGVGEVEQPTDMQATAAAIIGTRFDLFSLLATQTKSFVTRRYRLYTREPLISERGDERWMRS